MAKYIDKAALVAEIDRQKIGYNVDGKHFVEYDVTRKGLILHRSKLITLNGIRNDIPLATK